MYYGGGRAGADSTLAGTDLGEGSGGAWAARMWKAPNMSQIRVLPYESFG